MGKVHIVGAGMAGLAAAVKLVEAGHEPVLYEMAGHAGGRCRSYQDSQLGMEIDNGNHLILGSNETALEYISLIGTRRQFRSPRQGRFRFVDATSRKHYAYNIPGFIPGASAFDYLRLLRLLLAGKKSTVTRFFPEKSVLFKRFIEPLTIAALNTIPSEASAWILKRIIIKTLLRGKKAGRYYLSKAPLSDSLIKPALELITRSGGSIKYHKTLKGGEADGSRIGILQFNDRDIRVKKAEAIIFALPAHAIAQLLPEITTPQSFNSILNVHFVWKGMLEEHSTPSFIGVTGSPLQWIFFKPGIISTTTSAANSFAELKGKKQNELAQLMWKEVCTVLNMKAPLPAHRVLIEKRATFAATPDNISSCSGIKTPYHNLFLAGDWTDTGLPATIESAVSSGFIAAQRAMSLLKTNRGS